MGRRILLIALFAAGCAQLDQPPAPVRGVGPPPDAVPAPVPAPTPAPPAVTPRPPPPTAEDEESRQASEILAGAQRVAQLSADEQKKELGMATQAYNRDRSNYARVKLGMLYALPGAATQDDARALSLLESVAGGTGALKALAVVVHAQVAERVKAQKRADQFKEQLDQLRAVERSIIERGQQSQTKKP
ncbi:MAG TPA: hypothetical protein VLD36_22125 [Burkholderiales bacterium]|nr:hypothetical protein [Burkholderiales bacterium]